MGNIHEKDDAAKRLFGPGGESARRKLRESAGRSASRAKRAARALRSARPGGQILAGTPVTESSFARLLNAVRGSKVDTGSREFKTMFARAKKVLGKVFTRDDIRQIAGAGKAGTLSAAPTAAPAAVRGVGALGKAVSGKAGMFGRLGTVGALGIAAIGIPLIEGLVGGAIEDRELTALLNRLEGDPELLKKTVLGQVEDRKLNALRVERNLRRLQKRAAADPALVDELVSRSMGNPVPRLATGQIRIGRQAVLDQEETLRRLAERADVFLDG